MRETVDDIPSMTHTDDMIDITQDELEQLVCENTCSICKAKQAVIRKDRSQAHGPRMEKCLMTQTAQTGVTVHDLDLLADDNITKDWKERKDGGKGGLAIDDKKGNVIYFETIGEVSHACSAFVGMCDYDHLVTAIDQFLGCSMIYTVMQDGFTDCRELIDVTFNATYNSHQITH